MTDATCCPASGCSISRSANSSMPARCPQTAHSMTSTSIRSIQFNPDEPNDRNGRPWAASPDNNGDSRDGETLPEPGLALGSHGGSPSRIVSMAPRNNDSPSRIGESRDGEAEVNGLVSDESAGRNTLVDARPVDASSITPVPSLEGEGSYDDDQIPRNEAIESESGPLSVVCGEVATSDDPVAASGSCGSGLFTDNGQHGIESGNLIE